MSDETKPKLFRDLRTTEVCQLKTREFKGEAGTQAIPYVEYASGRTRDLEAGEEKQFGEIVAETVEASTAPATESETV